MCRALHRKERHQITAQIGQGALMAIQEFQKRVVCLVNADGKVDPGGATIKELRRGIAKTPSEPLLKAVIPGAGAAIVSKYFNALVAGLNANQINTPLRTADFLAQLGHESVDLRHPKEAVGNLWSRHWKCRHSQLGQEEHGRRATTPFHLRGCTALCY